MNPDTQFKDRMQSLDGLVQKLGAMSDSEPRSTAMQAIQLLMEMHGTALQHLLDRLHNSGPAGAPLILQLADDPLVGSLLLLYDLHPLTLETRVKKALEQVRPYLQSHGGNVELVSIQDATVTLQMQGSCHGCPSSAMTIKSVIEEAILELAPDVTRLDVRGLSDAPAVEHSQPHRVELLVHHQPSATTRMAI